jgi:hypothetical protein
VARIWSRGGQQDSILSGKAQASRWGHVGASIRKVRKPRAIQPESLMQIAVDQRQQCRPCLAWWTGLFCHGAPDQKVLDLQRLASRLSASGGNGDAIAALL